MYQKEEIRTGALATVARLLRNPKLLKIHIAYLRHVFTVKRAVYDEAVLRGVPPWIAILHDWQQLTPREWGATALMMFGPFEDDVPLWLTELYDLAWLHHLHSAPHHWQYWIIVEGGKVHPLPMKSLFVKLMVADWVVNERMFGKHDVIKAYLSEQERFIFHPDTRLLVERELGIR